MLTAVMIWAIGARSGAKLEEEVHAQDLNYGDYFACLNSFCDDAPSHNIYDSANAGLEVSFITVAHFSMESRIVCMTRSTA